MEPAHNQNQLEGHAQSGTRSNYLVVIIVAFIRIYIPTFVVVLVCKSISHLFTPTVLYEERWGYGGFQQTLIESAIVSVWWTGLIVIGLMAVGLVIWPFIALFERASR